MVLNRERSDGGSDGAAPQIVVEDLRKTFDVAVRRVGIVGALAGVMRREHRRVHALAGLSFSMGTGEMIGLIGPNGAGKSTLVKILSGVLVPSSGRCEVGGRVPWRMRVEHVRGIGVVFGQRTQLWWDLPVAESFDLLRDIYRVDALAYRRALDELVDRLDLAELLDVPVRQLSLGQRMRCDLAASLLHAPPILFLDEPTIGLDAVAKLAVRSFVRRLNRERGVTVILTTHDMDDIEALCSRVMVISDGRILTDGTLDDLRARVTTERHLIVDLEDESASMEDEDARVVSRIGARVVLAFEPARVPPAVLVGRIAARHAVRDLRIEDPPIEEIVARIYAGRVP